MLHVILYEPEIPPNTGNIIRLCANTGCRLHLVQPLGFEISDTTLRRAGLDYHDMARVQVHRSLELCLAALGAHRLLLIETGAERRYSDLRYAAGDALLFGPETRGLPGPVLKNHPDAPRLSIPMCTGNRSLNLSNAVALVVYEAWRQLGFAGAAGDVTAS
jgi:tRNA (cytidine/uridine-2'-O-)-methyltransferase